MHAAGICNEGVQGTATGTLGHRVGQSKRLFLPEGRLQSTGEGFNITLHIPYVSYDRPVMVCGNRLLNTHRLLQWVGTCDADMRRTPNTLLEPSSAKF